MANNGPKPKVKMEVELEVKPTTGGADIGVPSKQEKTAPPKTPVAPPKPSAENEEENEEGEEGNETPGEEQAGEQGAQKPKEDKKGGATEAVTDAAKKKAGEEITKKAAETAATVATGGAAKIGLFLAKYGKYIVIFFILCLILIYFILLSGIFGGSGPQVPLDAKKNAREIAKVKAVALNSAGKSGNEDLYKEITETSLKENITNLKDYLAQNKNGLTPGEISDLNTKLDAILNEFNTIKPDLDKLRKLEVIPETELKLKDPDQFSERKDLRKKVDASFVKMWQSIREIFKQLGIDNV